MAWLQSCKSVCKSKSKSCKHCFVAQVLGSATAKNCPNIIWLPHQGPKVVQFFLGGGGQGA